MLLPLRHVFAGDRRRGLGGNTDDVSFLVCRLMRHKLSHFLKLKMRCFASFRLRIHYIRDTHVSLEIVAVAECHQLQAHKVAESAGRHPQTCARRG